MPETVELCCEIALETDMHWLVSDGDKRDWIPMHHVERWWRIDNVAIIKLPAWLAREKGFIRHAII